MWVIGLDGKRYSLRLKHKEISASSLHIRARNLLKNVFPFDTIYDEVKIPNTKFRLDLFIPQQQLVVEIDGKQHFQLVEFFHKTKSKFYKAKHLDRLKNEWCETNGFTLVRLPYDESDEQWGGRLREV